ncbi:MAG: polyphosphate polymerase domain-containing protein [Clostridiales bacterium]|nr:polyphosphate polymerase domain-containing protein [Candidatus Blautia equi]
MKGRHEIKHYISLADYYVLRQRLRAVLKPDSHTGPNGAYQIRSLYFDTPEDTALQEKLDGVRDRDKFRIRYYNQDTSFIQLEKKSKRGDACIKISAGITETEAQRLADGDYQWLKEKKEDLFLELYEAMDRRGLRAKTIVDYERDPFVYEPGNVRITLDHHIRTGIRSTDFLNPDCVTIPAAGDVIILEVKWDAFLPDIVRDAVQLQSRSSTAFSKYAACRMFE